MRYSLLAVLLITQVLLFVSHTNAQNNVGIGTLNPNSNSILELESTDMGFLVPRMTSAQRNAIATAGGDAALLVYDTDESLFYYWDGTQWIGFPQAATGGSTNIAFDFDPTTNIITITDDGGTLTTDLSSLDGLEDFWHLNGNTGTSAPGNFIGTIDNNPWAIRTNNTERMRVSDGGNVGIGTTNPTFILDVNDRMRLRSGATGTAGIWFNNTGNSAQNAFLGTVDDNAIGVFAQGLSDWAMNVNTNTGYVGIGTLNQDAPLHVFTSTGTVGNPLSRLARFTNNVYSWEIRVGTGNGWFAWVPVEDNGRRWQINKNDGTTVFNVNAGAPENSFFMGANGHIEIGTGAGNSRRINLPNLANEGGRGRAQLWETYSDGRIKSNQREIEYGLTDILKMQPKSYDQHNSHFLENSIHIFDEKSTTVGLIAQELYTIFPEAVSKPADESADLWSVSYEKIVPVLIKAIQEQQQEITTLRNSKNLMQSDYDYLLGKFNQLSFEVKHIKQLLSTKFVSGNE